MNLLNLKLFYSSAKLHPDHRPSLPILSLAGLNEKKLYCRKSLFLLILLSVIFEDCWGFEAFGSEHAGMKLSI